MKRVLILGGSGFIGETLYKELCSYFDTYATYCSSKSFKHNQHYYQFNMDEGGLEAIIKDVKPKLIISALRGNFESQLETHDFLTDFIKKTIVVYSFFLPPMYLMPSSTTPHTNMIKHFRKAFMDV